MTVQQTISTSGLNQIDVKELASRMRGKLILPEDDLYEEACKVYNGMIEKRPALLARCVSAADVIAAVNFARENNLLLAMRGGGHNGAGLGTCDDGLVIDLSRCAVCGLTLHAVKCASRAAVSGATLIKRLTPSIWLCPPDSYPRPAWADLPSAAALVISLANMA